MYRRLVLAILLALSTAGMAGTGKLSPPKRDMRTNPPGKFLAPGYYVPSVFDGETVSIACADGYQLAGDFIKKHSPKRGGSPGVLFLHEVGKNRRSWYPLTMQIGGRECIILAVDLRGCGENPSLNKSSDKTLAQMPETDVRKMLDDVRNALSFLSLNPGTDPENIGIIGSGLGANLAIAAAAEPWGKGIKTVIAISPSLNDHGYQPLEAAGKTGNTFVCLAASRGDTTAFQAASALYAAVTGPKELFEGEGNASGVGLFGAKPAVYEKGGSQDRVLFAFIQQWTVQGLMQKNAGVPPRRKPANK